MSEAPKRRIPWLRVFVEGVVIVASVLLALAADAWWDQRQERREEIEVLEGLEADFEATLAAIQAQRVERQREVTNATRLISLGGTDRDQVSAETVDTLLADLISGEPLAPVDATLRALLNGEGLEVISNPQLRGMLAGWSPLLDAVRNNEDQSRNSVLNQFIPYLYDRVSFRRLDAVLPGMADPPSSLTVDTRDVLGELRFENHISDLLFFRRERLRHFDRLEEHTVKVLRLIGVEMGR